MKKRFGSAILLMLLVAIIAGCSDKDNSSLDQDWMSQEPIEVNLIVPEEYVEPGTLVTLRAQVTQSGEIVEDADRVIFEIWREGSDEEHERITAEHVGDGFYAVEKNFSDPGVYNVVSHVDARTWHIMPKKQFAVGDVEIEVPANNS